MHYLVIDTCVWGDLLVNEFSLVPKLAQLVDQRKVTVVLPDLIITEWDRIKNKLTNQIIKKINELNQASELLISLTAESAAAANIQKITSLSRADLEEKIKLRIAVLEKIIKSESTILLPISRETESLAIEYALDKKAPFREKNGMADALIFFTAVEWANENSYDNKFFISINTADFSNKESRDWDNLSPDLIKLVENNGLKFFPVLARVLNDIEESLVTEEEVRTGDLIVDQVRIEDELIDAMYRRDCGIEGMLHRNSQIEKILEHSNKVERMLGNSGKIERLLDHSNKIERMLGGSSKIERLLDHSNKIERMLGGSSKIEKMLEHISKIEKVSGIEKKFD